MNIEKENTFRALKDEPLLAKHQWRCRLGLHSWMPWEEPISIRHGTWDFIEQYRRCGFCGKAQRHILSKT
jgi:hypothetical protein